MEGPYVCTPWSNDCGGVGGGLRERLWGVPVWGGRGPRRERGSEVPPGSHTPNILVFLPRGQGAQSAPSQRGLLRGVLLIVGAFREK